VLVGTEIGSGTLPSIDCSTVLLAGAVAVFTAYRLIGPDGRSTGSGGIGGRP